MEFSPETKHARRSRVPAVLVALTLAVALAGCGGDSDPSASEPGGTTGSVEPSVDPALAERDALEADVKQATSEYKQAFEAYLADYQLEVDADFNDQLDAAFKNLTRLSSAFEAWRDAVAATIEADINLDLSNSELNGYAKLFEDWLENQRKQRAVFIRCGGLDGLTQTVSQCMFTGAGLAVIEEGQEIGEHLAHYQLQNSDLSVKLPEVDISLAE